MRLRSACADLKRWRLTLQEASYKMPKSHFQPCLFRKLTVAKILQNDKCGPPGASNPLHLNMYKSIFIRCPNRVWILFATFFCALALLPCASLASSANPKFVFSCSAKNDLYVLSKKSGLKPVRYETPEKAISAAPHDSIVLLLADGYPTNTLKLTDAIFQTANQKNLRLYVEFPSYLPGITLGLPKKMEWERFVVNGDHFGSGLPNLRN